jgi:hypothetical protein
MITLTHHATPPRPAHEARSRALASNQEQIAVLTMHPFTDRGNHSSSTGGQPWANPDGRRAPLGIRRMARDAPVEVQSGSEL